VYASDAQANALVVPVVLPSIQLAMLRDVAPMWHFRCVGTDGGYGFFMDAGQRYGINMLLTQKRLTGTLLVRHEQGKETCGALQTLLAVT